MTKIPLEVDKFDLSNHAGHDALSDFARKCSPSDLVLFHAPVEGSQALEEELSVEMKVHSPENNSTIVIHP
jgi:Cft2 family RNA processing exonuclease